MNIITEIKLNNGYTNRTDSDTDIPAATGDWHPLDYAEGDVVCMSAEGLHESNGVGAGLSADEKSEAICEAANEDRLGITAVCDGERPEKWTCEASGKIYRNGEVIGTFTASTYYRFDQ